MATSTIGSTGRDYADLDTWWAALPATLTEQEIAEVYQDGPGTNGEYTKSGEVVLDGITTSASNSIIIRPAAGEAFYDNIGSGALTYNAANGVALRNTATFTSTFSIEVDHWEVIGLQIKGHDGAGTNRSVSNGAGTAGFGYFRRCIFNDPSGNPQFVSDNLRVVNCIFEKVADSSFDFTNTSSGDPQFIHCTLAAPFETADAYSSGNFVDPHFKGCALFGGAQAVDSSGPTRHSFSDCVTDLASINGTSVTNNALSAVFADQFESVSTTTPDWRVKAGADLINHVTTIYSDADGIDILGNTRDATTPTAGAVEYISGGGGATVSGTGDANLSAITGSADGLIEITGTSAAALSALAGSASGTLGYSGTASASLDALTADASGTVGDAVSGTADANLQAVTASADGVLIYSGTGTGALSALTASASGSFSTADFIGSGAASLSAMTAAANGILVYSGAGAGTLGQITANADGVIEITGTAAATLGAIIGSASGTFSGFILAPARNVLFMDYTIRRLTLPHTKRTLH